MDDVAPLLALADRMLWVTALVAAPVLLASLAVGLVVGIVQAATSVNEQTLTFIPKLAVTALVLVLFGASMMGLVERLRRGNLRRRSRRSGARRAMFAINFGFGPVEAEFWRWAFAMTRIAAALFAAPLFGAASVPPQLRVIVSGALAVFACAWLPLAAPPPLMSAAGPARHCGRGPCRTGARLRPPARVHRAGDRGRDDRRGDGHEHRQRHRSVDRQRSLPRWGSISAWC